jgi:hypothetical protein
MIFLSASIPDPKRDPRYFVTADVIAIRDAVKALVTVVVPKSTLVWGGHPAITPLVRLALLQMDTAAFDNVILYQSLFFERAFPEENKSFERVMHVPAGKDIKESINMMRYRMLYKDNIPYSAGIFIGGMEGVETEFNLFREYHPSAKLFPIASTGGAAAELYKNMEHKDKRLAEEYAYMDLFRSLDLA